MGILSPFIAFLGWMIGTFVDFFTQRLYTSKIVFNRTSNPVFRAVANNLALRMRACAWKRPTFWPSAPNARRFDPRGPRLATWFHLTRTALRSGL